MSNGYFCFNPSRRHRNRKLNFIVKALYWKKMKRTNILLCEETGNWHNNQNTAKKPVPFPWVLNNGNIRGAHLSYSAHKVYNASPPPFNIHLIYCPELDCLYPRQTLGLSHCFAKKCPLPPTTTT